MFNVYHAAMKPCLVEAVIDMLYWFIDWCLEVYGRTIKERLYDCIDLSKLWLLHKALFMLALLVCGFNHHF